MSDGIQPHSPRSPMSHPFAFRLTTTVIRGGKTVEVPLRGDALLHAMLDAQDDPDTHPGMTLIARWLTSPSIRSPRTRDAYATDVEQLITWATSRNLALDRIGRADLERWLSHLEHTAGMKPSTRARKLAAASSFFNYLLDHGHVATNPTTRIPRSTTGQARTQPLSQANAAHLRAAAARSGHLDNVLVTLMLLAGLRVSEVCSRQRADVRDGGEVRFLHVDLKGGRTLQVPIDGPGATIGHAIDQHLAERTDSSPALVADSDGRPLNRHKVTYRLDRLAASIGLGEGRLGPHRLRATFITVLSDLGVPLLDTQLAVGHSDVNTTRRYYDQNNAWKRHPAAILADATNLEDPDRPLEGPQDQ